MKMKMPLPYLSNSAFELFQKDPMAYYTQYYVARLDESKPAMDLGKIFQLAWCDPKYDYVAALKKLGFNGDKARAMKNALTHPATVRLPKRKTEKQVIVKHPTLAYPILAQFDGIETDDPLIVENKWGIPWTQERVDTGIYFDMEGKRRRARQITWYILAYKLKYGKMPKFLLQSFNGKNGVVNKFWAKRTVADLKELTADIESMVRRIEAGDFKKYN